MYKKKHVAVIIAAGGQGIRFASDLPKQFLDVGGQAMLLRAAMPYLTHGAVDEILFVLPQDRIEMTTTLLCTYFGQDLASSKSQDSNSGRTECLESTRVFVLDRTSFGADALTIILTIGGAERTESVRNGLSSCSFESGIVLIHDAARPYVSGDVIDRVLDASYRYGVAIPVIPVSDTIYRTSFPENKQHGPHVLLDVPNRESLYSVQTPQGFDLFLIREAHLRAERQGVSFTDDGSLVQTMTDHSVTLVEGDPANIKITHAEDLNRENRVGIGFDAHRFVENRRLILGGVEIPYVYGLLGHSDADVLTHALMDAMLGALSLGDIGKLFPDTDVKYKNADSMKLLAEVRDKIEKNGYRVSNADLVIVAEKPRLAAYIPAIRKRVADALGLPPDAVGVKATTTEGLGFTGREEGIGSQAVVMLTKIVSRGE
ncbi:MAG: 2-C-methyl-D-erythritol 2,4-cyclodiphosphate synthase [Clostridiales Family XIII bacterium]|jgi:2-C-methyl-D-erythritol 4-phosphate cytidylyltransferase/2-C-methyl-D-erythritol 2,4-cyclodiphosphate synthase|nr:2-C-methyl-D-erythritol 2,4-cyclodiphosphate synthase [Clostridiales Family XIII bacterium]